MENQIVVNQNLDSDAACQIAMHTIKKCIAQNDFLNAEKLIDQYLIVKRDIESRQFASMIKMNLGKYEQAKELCLENLQLKRNAEDYTNIALIERSLYNLESAYGYAKYAYELKPNSAAIAANFGIISKVIGKNKQAKSLIDRAVELEPNSWMYIFNKASIFSDMGNLNKAKNCYEQSLKLNPLETNVNIDYFYCLAKLKMYKKAWPHYEYRYKKIKSLQQMIRETNRPVIQIKQKTYDQHICILPEQGMGDNLMFFRFVKKFQEIAPHSYYFCPASLLKIAEHLDIRYKPDFDESCTHVVSIMSLPYHLGIEKIPEQETIFTKTNKRGPKIKLGICWAGSPMHPMDKHRSTYLSSFDSFLNDNNFEVYSFQKDTRPRKYSSSKKIYDYAKNIDNYNIINLSDKLIDGYETAKLLNEMDLFISVDSYPIHLASLANIKSYVLVGDQPDWRWGLKSSETDWYSNIKIIRKKKNQSYKSVVSDLHKKIKDELQARPLS